MEGIKHDDMAKKVLAIFLVLIFVIVVGRIVGNSKRLKLRENITINTTLSINDGMAELVDNSRGLIKDIQLYASKDNLNELMDVEVIVSDVWYDAEEYEKERFVEQVSEIIENALIVYENEDGIEVYDYIYIDFYDINRKQVATGSTNYSSIYR